MRGPMGSASRSRLEAEARIHRDRLAAYRVLHASRDQGTTNRRLQQLEHAVLTANTLVEDCRR